MSKRGPQIFLKTDEHSTVLELSRKGKFAAKSSGGHENRVFLEGDKLEVAVKSERWVLTRPPAGPRPAVERYGPIFRTTETALQRW